MHQARYGFLKELNKFTEADFSIIHAEYKGILSPEYIRALHKMILSGGVKLLSLLV